MSKDGLDGGESDQLFLAHGETEESVAVKGTKPNVIRSVKSAGDLIKVISKSHSPFPVVTLENVVAVSELSRVSVSLSWFETVSTSHGGSIVDVDTIGTLCWLKSLVIPSWISSHSSAGLTWLRTSSGSEASQRSSDLT